MEQLVGNVYSGVVNYVKELKKEEYRVVMLSNTLPEIISATKKKYDLSIYHSKRAIDCNPLVAQTHNNYALALEQIGKIDLAIKEIRLANFLSSNGRYEKNLRRISALKKK